MDNVEYVQNIFSKANKAMSEVSSYSQKQIDDAIKSMLLAFREKSEYLAKLAVDETGYGNFESKIEKNYQAPASAWYALKNKKSVGVIDEDAANGIVYMAKPVGRIVCITPSTNPSTTILYNAAYGIKGLNAVIISPHPAALRTSIETVNVLREALKNCGVPENIIQVSEIASSEISKLLLAGCDRSLIAGTAKTVAEGYSSGHPSIGVSHGNVQVVLDRNVDYQKAIKDAIYAGYYDNALICSCTQGIIVPKEIHDDVVSWASEEMAYVISEESEIDKIRNILFPSGNFNRDYVGKDALYIAKKAEVSVPESIKLLIIDKDDMSDDDPLLNGEMASLTLLHSYSDFEEVLPLMSRALDKDGKGHSCVIYSNDKERVKQFAQALPLTRILVNQLGLYAGGQQLKNGLNPTANLACGSWANNGQSHNITYKDLINICAVVWPWDNHQVPAEETIWAE